MNIMPQVDETCPYISSECYELGCAECDLNGINEDDIPKQPSDVK